jgi:Fe-S-cluster containining protein
MELAKFVAELPANQSSRSAQATTSPLTLTVLAEKAPASPQASPGSCVFQVEGLCTVHGIRPFGCRVFFCDETATDWQYEQYDRFHAQLRRLHEQLDVPYFYVEWRAALAALRLV